MFAGEFAKTCWLYQKGPMIHSVAGLMIMHSLLLKKKNNLTVDFPRNFVPKKVPPKKSDGLES